MTSGKNPSSDSLRSLRTGYEINLPFESVYKKLALPLTKFIIKRVGGNQDMVDEVFSRTISAAWQGFGTFKNKSTYFTWLCRIALNKIADYYRGQINKESRIIAPFLEDIANIEDDSLSAEEKLALQDIRTSVRNCLNLLPEDKRQLLYLRYWMEMSIKQIAKTFGTTERSIEGKLYRARQMLKNIYENKHPEIAQIYIKKEE